MSRDSGQSKEDLRRQLEEYFMLARRPYLSAGAKAVVALQIAHIQSLLNKMDGF